MTVRPLLNPATAEPTPTPRRREWSSSSVDQERIDAIGLLGALMLGICGKPWDGTETLSSEPGLGACPRDDSVEGRLDKRDCAAYEYDGPCVSGGEEGVVGSWNGLRTVPDRATGLYEDTGEESDLAVPAALNEV
jgi:hypothetical protein